MIIGRDSKIEERPGTWVWASLDGEAKAEALPHAASLGTLRSRSQAVGRVTRSGHESLKSPFWVQKQTLHPTPLCRALLIKRGITSFW